MKKYLFLLIAVLTTIGVSAQTFSYAGINYEIKNGVAYVAEGKYSGDITVQPMVYYGTTPYVVTGINEGAFKILGMVTSVSLPSSIIDIGEDAFYYCYSLNAINIPSQVRVIRKSTFTD
ncbi:MAG: leucine-rich repeat protein [Bacteroidaceae bacterium]|nr:leucine-rich repeat protein [Bacteroidaceae bacterium]